jgi:16S rRNA (guanine1516-N2)-methyltransferase
MDVPFDLASVTAVIDSELPQAAALASRYDIDLSPSKLTVPPTTRFIFEYIDSKLTLASLNHPKMAPLWVDFVEGKNNHRRQFGGGKNQSIAKAVGIQAARKPIVLDATAGLGADAFVLASLGCQVTMHERNPWVYELLLDALVRLQNSTDTDLLAIAQRLKLSSRCSLSTLMESADVVYLDPMFPERKKSALVKKEMQIFHELVGADTDSDELLPLAIDTAKYRVVVKRPKLAPPLADQEPSYSLKGKSGRFDIYALKAIK